ncbi:MAG: LytR C-terminal domain-containing protein [Actinomycetota bacterium]|nr:LytR C-terminal domain-containing protein [Actinomycetota bacterium]
MSYIVESGASSSRRARRRRALITLAVVALMLFFAFWYAYSYFRASGEKTPAAPPVSCTPAASAPRPQAITVNVYNATNRNGLAARTATEVRKRGFKVSTVANDPLKKTVAVAAEVRYGKASAASGKVVLALVRGAKAVQDGRTDGSVDLVLGDKFTALAPPAKPAPAQTTPKTAATTSAGQGGATTPTRC